MTVQELMQQLYFLPQEMKILVAIDEEGNGFHPLQEVGKSYAHDENGYNWETYHPDDLTDDPDPEIGKWSDDKKYKGDLEEVLVLWP